MIAIYFDSHAHYYDERFDNDRETLLQQLHAQGINIINTSSDMASSAASVALAEKYPFICTAVGVHPHNAQDMKEEDLDTLSLLSQHKKTVAIGEIGLDFHYDYSPREVQRSWFKKQLDLAVKLQLPVIIHSRDAAAETMQIVKESDVCKGVVHCYSGSLPMALEYIEMGFYIGIGGPVTYKNAQKTREVAAGIPLDRLLIETDAPYLSPEPHRGKRNDSSKLVYIAEAIAQARGINALEIAKATSDNTRRLFGIA